MNFNLLKIEETNNIYNIILSDPKKQNTLSEEMKKMKERSHKYCFIANSLSKDVEIQIN